MLLSLVIKISGIHLVPGRLFTPSTPLQFLNLLDINSQTHSDNFFGEFSGLFPFKLLSKMQQHASSFLPRGWYTYPWLWKLPQIHSSLHQPLHTLPLSHLYLTPSMYYLILSLAYSFCSSSIMLLALLSHWTANPSHPCFCCRLCKRNWLLLCKFHLKTHLPSPWPMTPSLLSNKAIQSYSLSLSFISPCSFVLSETLKYGTQPLAFCTFFTLALL